MADLRPRTHPVRGWLGLLGALTLLGTLVLAAWAVIGVRRVEALRHEDVADRLFDAMEDELSALVAKEESRSFLEYRTFYVADNAGGQPIRSPLADAPSSPVVLGYFQVDPDGTMRSPGDLDEAELPLAVQQGWNPTVEKAEQNEIVEEVVNSVQDWREVDPAASVPNDPVERLNNLGSARRQSRSVRKITTGSRNASAYQSSVGLEEQIQEQQKKAQDRQVPALVLELATPGQVPDIPVDVRITPMVGQRVGDGPEGPLILHRTVRVNGQDHRQGLVLDTTALAAHLEARVLQVAQLPQVRLSWDGTVPAGRWTFVHRMGPPFQDMQVAAGIDPIPEVRGMETSLLVGGVVVLLLALATVGLALSRALSADLAFAARRQDFVAAVSHELRTPLTSIRMYAEMLRDGMVPNPEKQHAYHVTIASESERLSRLISNVLELARMEKGQRRAESVVGDVRPIVEQVVESLRPHAEAQGVELVLDGPDPLPPARVDRDALVQVLFNLIDNAVKFGKPKAGERSTVRVRVEASGDGVAVKVRDAGPGVPRGQLPLIFEAFYRGERELTRTTKGTGIGLALVAGLVADMGGQVKARNRDGGGLEVTVELAAP